MIEVIIIILVFLALVILLSPVTISFNSTRAGGKIDGFFSMGWIIFLFRYALKDRETDILVFGRKVARLQHKEKPPMYVEKEKHSGIKKPIPHPEDILSLSGPVLRLIKELIYAFKLKYLDIDIRFGLNDPAHTGIIMGILHSIFGYLRAGKNIRWTVDFTKPILEWDMKAKVAITPISILPPIVRFVTTRQVFRAGMRFIRD
ncbi:MAG: DUF2953 domain-containing protein [Candidatus Methanoperedens sp.]|nr:DUF2953 domain-containing protein [Candidatus Methanoperedens sp.]